MRIQERGEKRGIAREDSAGIYYPESDGEPIGETQVHIAATFHLYGALEDYFDDVDDVLCLADILMYYVEGDPKKFKVPDVLVARGIRRKEEHRRTFKIWEEGVAPALVIEVTSAQSKRMDTKEKPALYAQLGVQEYIVFDPLEEYLKPAFQGFRLVKGEYRRVKLASDGSFQSRALGLRFEPEGNLLRVVDPATGKVVLSRKEALRLAEAATKHAEEAKAEARRLREELDRLRRETE